MTGVGGERGLGTRLSVGTRRYTNTRKGVSLRISKVRGSLRRGVGISGILLLVAGGAASALGAELSGPAVETAWGGRINASVEFVRQGAAVAGLQFDLQYNRKAFSIDATAGSATKSAGKQLVTRVLPNGNLRVLIFGLDKNVLSDGSVVNLAIQVGANPSPGAYVLRLVNVRSVGPGSQPVFLSTHDGRITITK